MNNLFIPATLACLISGLLGIIISLDELLKFIQAKTKASEPTKDGEALSPFYKRKARAHRNEFFYVLLLATILVFMFLFLLGTS